MPIHDWTRVPADIFHDFHHGWIADLSRALNGGLLPHGYYALIERATPEPEPMPDVVIPPSHETMLNVLRDEPRARFRMTAEAATYAQRRSRIAIRHQRDHRLVAMVDVIAPGSKGIRHGLRALVRESVELLRRGVHLLVVDLFSPGPRDPQGIHKAIWDEISDDEFVLPSEQPLTLVAYAAGSEMAAYLEPTSVGATLPDMPLFLTADSYIPVLLESTYQSAWDAVPSFWRDVLTDRATL